jgi:secondary thiamine-phosphate synthase enzyme
MSKRSIVTVRDRPILERTEASGMVQVCARTFEVRSHDRVDIIDITDRVTSLVAETRLQEGVLSLFSLHTTCAVFINEFQSALVADIKRLLDEVIARDGGWLHNDPRHSDCDRTNADAHLRALFLGHTLSLQVSGGELVLGQWQRVLMAELDGPRARSLRLTVMGVR